MCHNPQKEWKLNLDKHIYIRDKEKKKKNNNQPEKGRRKVGSRTGKNGRARVVRE